MAWYTESMDSYIKVCNVSDIQEGKLSSFMVEGIPVLIQKIEDKFYAVNSTCAHKGADLSKGRLKDNNTVVKCPWHGSEYDIRNGKPVSGPEMTKISVVDKASKMILPCLVSYETKVENNEIYIKGPVRKQEIRFKK